ncbi:MAG: UDP-N-acetylmuramate dehydrogenase [Pseudomonadota bacterium]
MTDLSHIETRGRLLPGYSLAGVTWLRVGGAAEWLLMPKDAEDLASFLTALPQDVPVFAMGVGSNLIVRDGGVPGVVIRLSRAFGEISVDGDLVTAGAAALDAQVAKRSAEAGLDLTFLRTIPGSIGGAVRMNAGCYGSYVADHLVSTDVLLRDGTRVSLTPQELSFEYRSSDVPDEAVILSAVFRAGPGDPAALRDKMVAQLAKRDETQPTKELTAGSTFRNPAGFSSTGKADDRHEMKAWSVIEAAGLRGATRGGAQMSPKHPNFLVNTGTATAADLEGLGEEVRERVFAHSGIRLEWEIMRIGEPIP